MPKECCEYILSTKISAKENTTQNNGKFSKCNHGKIRQITTINFPEVEWE